MEGGRCENGGYPPLRNEFSAPVLATKRCTTSKPKMFFKSSSRLSSDETDLVACAERPPTKPLGMQLRFQATVVVVVVVVVVRNCLDVRTVLLTTPLLLLSPTTRRPHGIEYSDTWKGGRPIEA